MAKKLLALLLALIMVVGLVACGEPSEEPNNDETTGQAENPEVEQTEAATLADPSTVQFSVMLEASIEDASQMPMMQMLEELTGYSPEFLEISPAAAEEQFELLWLEEELPNVVTFGLSTSTVERLANEGLLADLAPYMTEENCPNMYKYLQEHEWDMLSDSEGHIYMVGTFEDSYISRGLCINTEWLAAVGMEMPETPDELLEVWRAFKTQDPNGNGIADEIPFASEMSSTGAITYLQPLFGMFGTVGGWQVDEDGNVFLGETTEDYKEGIKWLRQAYAEGLIDPELFTMDLQSFKAKAQSDPLIYGSTLGFVYSAPSRSFTAETWTQYETMLPMINDDGVRLWLNPSATASTLNKLCVVTADTDPETITHIVRWFDAMYEPRIGAQLDQAPLGIGLTDRGDGYYEFGYVEGADIGEYQSYDDWRAAMHTQCLPKVLTDYAEDLADFRVYIEASPIETVYAERNTYYRENCVLNNYLAQDAATEEETEINNTYETEFNAYWRNQLATWITGQGDVDAEWDEYIQTLYDLGLQELTDMKQARYDRYVG